jgi:hypothetical protein
MLMVVGVLLSSGSSASAQLKGHYIPGFTGLENGTQPPPSITLAVAIRRSCSSAHASFPSSGREPARNGRPF